MNPCELTAAVTTIAIIIADSTPDDDDLTVISLAFTQLGYTLDTIVAQRRLLSKDDESLPNEQP